MVTKHLNIIGKISGYAGKYAFAVFSSLFLQYSSDPKLLHCAVYNCTAWEFTGVKLSAQSTFTVILDSVEVPYIPGKL